MSCTISRTTSSNTSPSRKRQRTSLPGRDEHTFGSQSSLRGYGTPTPSQFAPASSQRTNQGKKDRMKAINDALLRASALSNMELFTANESVGPPFIDASSASTSDANEQHTAVNIPLVPVRLTTPSPRHSPTLISTTRPSNDIVENIENPVSITNALSGFARASEISSTQLGAPGYDSDDQYDETCGDMTADDLTTLAGMPLELCIGAVRPVPMPSSSNPFLSAQHSLPTLDEPEDSERPQFTSTGASFPTFAFASGRKAPLIPSAASVVKAKQLLAKWDDDATMDPVSEDVSMGETTFSGFSLASNKGLILPSTAALASAERKRKQWETDETLDADVSNNPAEGVESNDAAKEPDVVFVKPALPGFSTPMRGFTTPFKPHFAAPDASERVINGPARTSTSAGFSTPSRPPPNYIRPSPALSALPASLTTFGSNRKPFKSPMLPIMAAKLRNTPSSQRPLSTSFPLSQMPPSTQLGMAAPPSTPDRPSCPASMYATPPQLPAGAEPMPASARPFSTPFKPGFAPGEPGRLRLDEQRSLLRSAPRLREPLWTPSKPIKRTREYHIFNLEPMPSRKSLINSRLKPQRYTEDELQEKGINVTELSQMTPHLALYYSFHSSAYPSPTPSTHSGATPTSWGSSEALQELQRRGCTLATKAWVDNHWGLILWKLAGMVCLNPDAESDPSTRRWTWAHVVNQLLYRYEKELQGGSRPPLRLVTAQDAPAGSPMVLCVSDILNHASSKGPSSGPPQLEVTDGWYKLKMEIDGPLIRAIDRGKLRTGQKIVVAGAYLSSGKKDAAEILDAYDSCSLKVSGNSCHLAPWHIKLGYYTNPLVSSLGSLTADGGAVSMVDIIVIKAFPVAYIEFVEDADGTKRREGPRTEKDERQADEKWKARRIAAVEQLKEQMEKRVEKWQQQARRLERKAGARVPNPAEDVAPDTLDDLCDELEEGDGVDAVIQKVSPYEAGWLAQHMHDRCSKERETFSERVEDEVKDLCRPREVKNFRVVVIKDARDIHKPAPSRTQLTIWDVMSLSFSEHQGPGMIRDGQRFVVTNLIPTQPRAWNPRGDNSEIFLSTRRDTRWRLVGSI